MSLLDAVADAIARDALLRPGESVLVALSGGADSVALLHALQRLGYRVEAAHFDHAMRAESAEDARWVAAHCGRWGVPCTLGRAEQPLNSEEQARQARYAFLIATAQARGLSVLALGHHEDDQAETLLFRLARGTGLAGLSGMRPVRTLAPDLRVIRPLLGLSRAAIEAALTDWQLPYLVDASNADPRFARNRIRSEVLPALRAINPAAGAHLAALARRAAEETALREEEALRLANHMTRAIAPGLGEIDRGALSALPMPLRTYLVRALLLRLGGPAWDARTLETALAIAERGGSADLAGGVHVSAEGAFLVLERGLPDPMPRPWSAAIEQPTAPWGWRIRRLETASGAPWGPTRAAFDPQALPADLVWRSARPDLDRFRPWGHAQERALGHYLARAEVPRHRQRTLLVAASGETVLWVVGWRRGMHATVERTPEDAVEMQATACFRV